MFFISLIHIEKKNLRDNIQTFLNSLPKRERERERKKNFNASVFILFLFLKANKSILHTISFFKIYGVYKKKKNFLLPSSFPLVVLKGKKKKTVKFKKKTVREHRKGKMKG